MTVFPDFEGVGGIDDIREVVGALLTVVLIVAVLMIIVSAIIWAIGSSNSNPGAATKGRIGVWVSLGSAALAGAGVAWISWLIDLGAQL